MTRYDESETSELNTDEAVSAVADPTTAKEIKKFSHSKPLTTCRVDPTGKYAFAGAEDHGIYRFDLETGEKVVYHGHDSWVRRLDFSSDGKTLYSSGWDGRIGLWDVEPAEITEIELTAAVEATEKEKAKPAVMQLQAPDAKQMIEAHQGFARWVHVSSDGKFVATCGNDRLVKLWSAKKMKLRRQYKGHGRHPYAVMIHPDGEELVSEDLMGEILVWGIRDGKQRAKIDASVMTGFDQKFQADMGGARDMAFSKDGRLLGCAGISNVVNSFAGQQDPIICVIDWKAREITHHLRTQENKPGVQWGVCFHEAGFVAGCFAGQSNVGTVEFWKLDQTKPESPETNDGVETPDDKGVESDAVGETKPTETDEQTTDSPAKPTEQKPFHVIKVDKAVRGLDFTADGRRFAIACADGSLRVYQL
ncbi:MAG: hypothetical protein VX738_15760 [Planctomycetota bacterium]|nr:hypothetical protein [Planctomycetota bacterium]